MPESAPPFDSYQFPDIGYVLTCECGYRGFNVILSNPTLDGKNDVVGFVCLSCGDSMAFGTDDKGQSH